MRWALLALLVVLVQFAAARPALADEPAHVRIEFSSPARDCQREEVFRAMLRGLLRAPLLDPPAERVLSVRIDPRPSGGYHLRLTVSTLDGSPIEERQLDYPPLCCFAVVYYAAFNAAVMINPPRPPAPPPPPPAPCPSCEVCAAPPPPPSPPPRPRPVPKASPKPSPPKAIERRWRGVVGLLYGANVSPSDAPGAQFGVQFRGSWWSAELDARYTFRTARAFEVTTLDTYTLAGIFAPCMRFDPLAVCGVVASGILGARALLPISRTDTPLSLSLGGRLTVESPPLPVRFPWQLALRLDAEAAGAVVPPEFRSPWDTAYGSGRALTWHGGASIVATF